MNWPLGAIRTIEEIEAIARTVDGKPYQSVAVYGVHLIPEDKIFTYHIRPGCITYSLSTIWMHVQEPDTTRSINTAYYGVGRTGGSDLTPPRLFRNYFMAWGYLQRLKSDQQKSNSEVSG